MPSFLTTLIRLSLAGTALSLVLALALRLLGGRISRAAGYYLWLLVLLRLVLPIGISLPIPSAVQADTPASQGVPQVVQAPSWVLPSARVAQSIPAPEDSEQINSTLSPISEQTGTAPPHFDTGWVWAGVWALGATVCLGRYVWGYRRLTRRIQDSAQAAPQQALDALQQLDPVGRVGLLVSPAAPGPLLLGVLRPVIVLPPQAENPDLLCDILCHELTHAHRRDLLVKWLAAGVTSLHWFNPAMILIRREVARRCELACDEAVVRDMVPSQRRHYGQTLLAMAAPPPPGMGLLATTLCEEQARLRERLVCIVKVWKKGPAALALTTALALVLGSCTLISGAQPARSPTLAPSPTPAPSADPSDLIQHADLYVVGDYTVAIPSDLADQLLVFPQEDNSDGALISVYEKASYEQGGGAEMDIGRIFSLVRWDQVRYEQEFLRSQGTLAGMSFFARDDSWYYGWSAPTEVAFYRADPADIQAGAEAFPALCQALNEAVPADFLARNGLTPYSDNEFFSRDFIWDGDHLYASYHSPDYSTFLTLTLSQPATQGEDGIWCVECWVEHPGPSFNRYYVLPATQGQTAAAYYAQLQTGVDQGHRPGLLDPKQVALEWLQDQGYDPSYGVTILEGKPGGNVYGRIEAMMAETGTLARVVFVDGEETNRQVRSRPADRYAEYGGESYPLIAPVLEPRLYSIAQAPASFEGVGVVYTTYSGDRLIFLASGLIGIDQGDAISWYTTTYDYDPNPYETMLATWQEWDQGGERVESEVSISGPEEPPYRVYPLEEDPASRISPLKEGAQ